MTSPCATAFVSAPRHVIISVNVDILSGDMANAGQAGLFGKYSYGRYGLREGIWRLLTLFQETGVPATFFMNTLDMTRHPRLLQAMIDGGHEIAMLGTVWPDTQHPYPEDMDLSCLARERDAFMQLLGQAPCGWRASNGVVTPGTLPELARLGYAYDSSFQDDDLPYLCANAAGLTLAQLPTFEYLTDTTFYAGRHGTARALKAWREEFDGLYAANGYGHLTLHTRGDTGSSRQVRVDVVRQFIDHVMRSPGTSFSTCTALARTWRQRTNVTEPFPA